MVKELSSLHNSHLKMRHREKPKSTQSYVKGAENLIQPKASQCNAQYRNTRNNIIRAFCNQKCANPLGVHAIRNCVRNILAVTLFPVTPVKYNFKLQK